MLGAIEVHPQLSHLGFERNWNQEIGGKPAILSTIEAISACPSIERLVLILPAEAEDISSPLNHLISTAALPTTTEVVTLRLAGNPSYPIEALRRQRRLSPSAWRGGWAIPYAISERGDPYRFLQVCQLEGVENLIVFPDAAPFLNAELIEEMIAKIDDQSDVRVRLSTLPPGLMGDIASKDFLEDIVRNGLALDAPFRFIPSVAERDLDTKGVFHWLEEGRAPVRHRLTGDSPRGLALLHELTKELSPPQMEEGSLSAWVQSNSWGQTMAGAFPAEIRIQLTDRVSTEDAFSLPVESGEGRTELPLDVLEGLFTEVQKWQETRVILSGGEPWLHSEFDGLLELLDRFELPSVVIETDGQGLNEESFRALGKRVEGVIVQIDATLEETYKKLRGGSLEDLESRLLQLFELAKGSDEILPFIGVEMRLCPENQEEAETFIDRWFEYTPWVLLSPHRNRAQQLPHESLHPYRLPKRGPCIRLEEQAVVHPNGQLTACDNDFKVLSPVGSLKENSLAEIWAGQELNQLRLAHREGDFTTHPLCQNCEDWCRRG